MISDLGIHEKNVGIVAWRLLQMLLNQHEKKSSTELHMAVTRKLLSLGAFLPSWLMTSYKVSNSKNPMRMTHILLNLFQIYLSEIEISHNIYVYFR